MKIFFAKNFFATAISIFRAIQITKCCEACAKKKLRTAQILFCSMRGQEFLIFFAESLLLQLRGQEQKNKSYIGFA